MSAPTVRPDKGPAVVTSPTIADAQLAVQIMAAGTAAGADQGFGMLFARSKPPTLAKLRKKHPQSSEEYRQVMAFLAQYETIATFVKQGILNETLVNDLFWAAGAWNVAAQICRDIREEAAEPRLYENFEWLATRAS